MSEAEHHFSLHQTQLDISDPEKMARWDFHVAKMQSLIAKFRNTQEVMIYAQKQSGFDYRIESAWHKGKLIEYETQLCAEFPHFKSAILQSKESPYSLKATLARQNQRLVSNTFFFNLRFVLQCLTWVKSPSVICEIGGGYGLPPIFG